MNLEPSKSATIQSYILKMYLIFSNSNSVLKWNKWFKQHVIRMINGQIETVIITNDSSTGDQISRIKY